MNQERLLKIILAPHISEKATRVAEKCRQYVFKVVPSATKPEIKQAVEMLFDVKVESVQVNNVRGKIKSFGQRLGRRNHWKKAYVMLQDGQEIQFTSEVGG